MGELLKASRRLWNRSIFRNHGERVCEYEREVALPLRKPALKIFVMKLADDLNIAVRRVAVARYYARQPQAVERRVLAHRVLGHVRKNDPITHFQRLFEQILADNVAG